MRLFRRFAVRKPHVTGSLAWFRSWWESKEGGELATGRGSSSPPMSPLAHDLKLPKYTSLLSRLHPDPTFPHLALLYKTSRPRLPPKLASTLPPLAPHGPTPSSSTSPLQTPVSFNAVSRRRKRSRAIFCTASKNRPASPDRNPDLLYTLPPHHELSWHCRYQQSPPRELPERYQLAA
ncbi:hypothetical protein BKA81DRAFT_25040 [Phyllosticta paracitricarpa]